ncbi:unnamed protein product, partial [Mesorhabditis spiculigera]
MKPMKRYLVYAGKVVCLLACIAFYKSCGVRTAEESLVFTAAELEENNFSQFRPYPIAKRVAPQRRNITKTQIAIVIMVKDATNDENYRIAVNSIRCYAEIHGYAYYHIDYSKNKTLQRMCPQEDFLFARHCIMVDLMKGVPNEWFLFFGADNGVINPIRRIEEYLPAETTVDVVFYNRFYNDEIMADTYLIRNTKRSHIFLNRWAEYYNLTKDYECSGTDNGAIQKGQGWSRDGWVTGTKWFERDLFFHGWKKEKLYTEWNLPFTSTDLFDKTCSAGDFERWKYDPQFKADCLDVDLELHLFFEKSRTKYYERLQTLRQMDIFPVKFYQKYGL